MNGRTDCAEQSSGDSGFRNAIVTLSEATDLLNLTIAENRELQKRVAFLEAALGIRSSLEVQSDHELKLGQVGDVLYSAQVGVSACEDFLKSAGLADTPTCVSVKWARHYVSKAAETFTNNKESLLLAAQVTAENNG